MRMAILMKFLLKECAQALVNGLEDYASPGKKFGQVN